MDDLLADHNGIMTIIYLSYALRILKLIIMVFAVSYFCGIFFYMWSDITNDFTHINDTKYGTGENFIDDNEFISNRNAWNRTLIVLYYAFTSLTTVGFGDYHPKSDYERIFIAIMLLFGVAIFSYTMGNFIQIINSIFRMMDGFEEDDNLSKFFGLIKQFNHGNVIE